MKKLSLTLMALALTATGMFAQTKPEAGSVGLGFRVTGLANVAFGNFMTTGLNGAPINDQLGILPAGTTVSDLVPQEMLFGRYYLSSDLALRAGLGINSLSNKIESTDSIFDAVTVAEQKTSAFSFGVSVGIEKHFASAAGRLDPYAGAQIGFGMLGAIKQTYSDNTNSDPATSTEISREWDGGSAFNVDLLAGFNYFFSDNFAIGAEMSWGFGSVSTGGDYLETTTATAGGTSVTSEQRGAYKWGVSGFRVGSTAGVNASIFW